MIYDGMIEKGVFVKNMGRLLRLLSALFRQSGSYDGLGFEGL